MLDFTVPPEILTHLALALYQRVKKGYPIAKLAEPSIGQKISIRYEILLDGLPVNQEKYLPKR